MGTTLINFLGQPGCVDKDTEYFNGLEWKPINEYKQGEKVLTYTTDGVGVLEVPSNYIKVPCDKLYHFHNTNGSLDQVLSEEHRIIYLTSKGHINEKTLAQLKEYHEAHPNGLSARIITHFKYNGTYSSITPDQLRLMIAISADGSLVKSKKKWRVRIYKTRKIERMRQLLNNLGISVDERVYKDGSHNFYVDKQHGVKEFPDYFYNLSPELINVFAEEIFLWDGNKSTYFTTIKKNADIAQFLLAQLGRRTSIKLDDRTNEETNNIHKSICYNVRLCKHKYIFLRRGVSQHGKISFDPVVPLDGYKYCFTVSSGMLILRRNNNIFITGNSGKSTLGTQLFTELKVRDYEVEFVNEFVKTWTYTGRKVNKFGQYYIFGMETENQSRLFNKVDYIIADSPVLLTSFYQQFYWGSNTLIVPAKEFYQFAEEEGVKVVNIFIDRKFKYNPKGRFQTEEESEEVRRELLKFMEDNGYEYRHLKVPIKERINTILDILGIPKEEPKPEYIS